MSDNIEHSVEDPTTGSAFSIHDLKPKPPVGGTKHDGGKPRMDLVPAEMIEALAQTLTYGANKYAENNWRQGLVFSRLRGAALRHFMAWSQGVDTDEESGLSHLEHAFTNLGFLVTFVREGRTELDDRWKYESYKESKTKTAATEPVNGEGVTESSGRKEQASPRFQGTYADFLKLNNVTREGDLK